MADQNLLQEYSDNRGVKLAVDRTAGVIPGVKLLGAVSARGREYPRDVMQKAMPLYEGVCVNVDHVDPGERRSLRDRIGVIKNVALREDGLYGDFHFNPKHALAEQVAWDAENAPQKLGFSHDARGPSKVRGGKVVVESIDKVLSVDLVANPATTGGLFESLDSFPKEEIMDLSKLTIQELRESRDDLVKTILAEADEGKKLVALEAQNKTLQEEIATLKGEAAQRLLVETIDGELLAAKLDKANKTHVSETFLGLLKNEPDASKRKALIEDRAGLVTAASKSASPQSASPIPGGQAAAPADAEQRARAWRQ